MAHIDQLTKTFITRFANNYNDLKLDRNELTVECAKENLRDLCLALRDEEPFKFDMLIDVCGVDYADYGVTEWATESTTTTGFSRGVNRFTDASKVKHKRTWSKPRFAVVYHLLSIAHNHRIRLTVFVEENEPVVDSVTDIWKSDDWFEREAFDLFGILFSGHEDLRRILTDYGFVGHPFRKDFPLIGQVAMRFDAKTGRCVYEPVKIMPRTLVPRVIRDDNRYLAEEEEGTDNG